MTLSFMEHYIYIYAFSRWFYPKQLVTEPMIFMPGLLDSKRRKCREDNPGITVHNFG